jgi:AcrR family transcriptional regulator
MREIPATQSQSKQRLLDAAEQLFAERGFEAVSVRDITHRADANVAAINYHFGTRDGLVALVISRYLTPVNEERLVRLETAERKTSGKSLPLEEILDAFARPLVGITRKSAMPERLLCKLLGRIFSLQGDDCPVAMEASMHRVNERFTRALGRALPSLAADELIWRIHLMVGGLIHLLMNQDRLEPVSSGTEEPPAMDAALSRFIRFSAAGLREGVTLEAPVKNTPQATFDFG